MTPVRGGEYPKFMSTADRTASKFCPYCGRPRKPEGRFCVSCGKEFRNRPSQARPRARRVRPGVIIILAALIVLVLAATSDFLRNFIPAQLGSTRAQYRLGAAYKRGSLVGQSFPRAAKWFGAAADAGLPAAQFEYGILLYYGLGVEQDSSLAFTYLRKAAEADVPEAQFYLGSLSRDSGNVDDAQEWLRRAAAQRYAPAEFCLANEYIAGGPFWEDYVAADVLLEDLIARGFTDAEKPRAYLRDSLMTAEQRAEADTWERDNKARDSRFP